MELFLGPEAQNWYRMFGHSNGQWFDLIALSQVSLILRYTIQYYYPIYIHVYTDMLATIDTIPHRTMFAAIIVHDKC